MVALRNQDKYNIDNVKEMLGKKGLKLLEDKYIDAKTKMLCLDKDGYYVNIIFPNFLFFFLYIGIILQRHLILIQNFDIRQKLV